MNTTRVYDWPTRLFHWSFAGLFIGAFFIAKTFDDDSSAYPYHMMLGMVMASAVFLRVIWGFIGSRYARFSSFALRPFELIQYFKDLIRTKTSRVLGHNPASSWAALMMMGLALGLALTGFLMSKGINKELFEEVHEIFAHAFLVVAIAHVVGVVLHTIRHKDMIGLSMLTGRKTSVNGGVGIESSHPVMGFIFVALVGGFALYLNNSYDPLTRKLNAFGLVLELGEAEEGSSSDGGHVGPDQDREHDGNYDEDHD